MYSLKWLQRKWQCEPYMCVVDAAMCTKLGELASAEVPGWTHDVPSQTSCALLRLLCIHVIHLSMAAEVVLKSGGVKFCTGFDETE